MAYAYARKRTRKTAAPKRRRPVRKPRVTKAVQTYVSRAVGKATEVKSKTCYPVSMYNTDDYQHITGGGLGMPDLSGQDAQAGYLIPNIWSSDALLTPVQGNMGDQRIGNRIKPVSLVMKGFIKIMQYNPQSNHSELPFEVHCIVYKRKAFSNGDPANLCIGTSGKPTDIDGTAEGSLLNWNKDEYIIYKHRVWRMRQPTSMHTDAPFVMTDSNVGTGTVVANINTGRATNPYFKRFAMKLPCPKHLRFNEGQTAPVNASLSVGFWIINGDGKELGMDQVRATLFMSQTLRYTDA